MTEDGTKAGVRTWALIYLIIPFLSKASRGAKVRGGGTMVSGIKTGNTRSKDRKIMLVLCYCERFEDGVRTVDGKEGERPVKGRELFLPVIDQHS